ncbi:MAG: thiamine pyrophosphate-binding protein [Blastocatellia bacterium]|nr:thiamine pyrophosphate-binding protein [Blastocatellia bacterium]
MAEMTGAQAIYEMMAREGVRYIFGNPGTTELPLMDLFAARDEINYILALHEDAALGMAAGYAEATGRAAAVNLHTNPGVAHALGNLYNAYRMGTPLVVTAGQQDTRALISEPLLTADLLELTRQHTKWAWEARHASEVPACLARAFQIAETPPTGPVFLSFPVNVMEERAEMDLPPVTRTGQRIRGDRARIEEAARILSHASNPAIIAGDGCARSGAVDVIVKLAEMLGSRVYLEPLNALMDFPTSHALYGGPLLPNARQTQAMLLPHDVIIILGVNTLVPLVHTGVRMIPAGARLIQIDVHVRELGKNYPAEVALLADIRSAVEELIETLAPLITAELRDVISRRKRIAIEENRAARAAFTEQAMVAPERGPVPPAYLVREMRAACAQSAVMVDEVVSANAQFRMTFGANEPNSYFYAKAGCLGLGLPLAIGVKLAMPDRQVICAVGDGSALYSIQSLWTAARYGVAVKFVIFNNASYEILKGGLLALGGASVERGIYPGTDIDKPQINFSALAESMGVAGRRVSETAELRAALDWAFAHDGPALLDVAITREVRSLLR